MEAHSQNSHLKFSLKEFSSLKVLLALFIVLLCLNLFVINIWILKQIEVSKRISVLGTKITTKTSTSSTCPGACVALINKSSAKTTVTSGSSAKEFFVSLGSGSTSSTDWTDITGVLATIDSSSYGKIKQAFFEPTIQNPNGNQKVWARLYNVTDKHPVWFSEVYSEGSATNLLTSPAITLTSGSKVYQVQMKTQLGATSNLTQSRIRITTY
ncbi:MAG TPA: hypothetical protein VJC10_02550 [Patescibacteria group bacterium]|nr:hypothetical protein [Patescibacteria group bacterium]